MDWDKYSKNLFVIQTHNQPGADAICSAYLLQRLLAIKGKKVSLLLVVSWQKENIVNYLPNGKNVEALPKSLSILDTFAFDHHKHDLKVEPAN